MGADRPWSTIEPELGQIVSEVVAHQTQACLWRCRSHLERGRRGIAQPRGPTPRAACSPPDQIDDLGTAGRLLAAAVTMAPPATRGTTPSVGANAAGFAAMGCDEVLIHTADVANSLGLEFVPDTHLTARVVHRLRPLGPHRRRPVGCASLGPRPDGAAGSTPPDAVALALRSPRRVGRCSRRPRTLITR